MATSTKTDDETRTQTRGEGDEDADKDEEGEAEAKREDSIYDKDTPDKWTRRTAWTSGLRLSSNRQSEQL